MDPALLNTLSHKKLPSHTRALTERQKHKAGSSTDQETWQRTGQQRSVT